jgi:hypothetical protein
VRSGSLPGKYRNEENALWLRRDADPVSADPVISALRVELATLLRGCVCSRCFLGTVELDAISRADFGAMKSLASTFGNPGSSDPPRVIFKNSNFFRRAPNLTGRNATQICASKKTCEREGRNPNPLHQVDAVCQIQKSSLSVVVTVKRLPEQTGIGVGGVF